MSKSGLLARPTFSLSSAPATDRSAPDHRVLRAGRGRLPGERHRDEHQEDRRALRPLHQIAVRIARRDHLAEDPIPSVTRAILDALDLAPE